MQVPHAVLDHRFDAPAAALAAIADRVKPVEHGILKVRRVHVPAFVLCLQQFDCLALC